jgi:hypothetical protein
MKVRGGATRRGDAPEYIKRMQQELFEVRLWGRIMIRADVKAQVGCRWTAARELHRFPSFPASRTMPIRPESRQRCPFLRRLGAFD